MINPQYITDRPCFFFAVIPLSCHCSDLFHQINGIPKVPPTSINISSVNPQFAHSLSTSQCCRAWQYTKQTALFSVERINLNSSQYAFNPLSCRVLSTRKSLTWLIPTSCRKSTNLIHCILKSHQTTATSRSFSSSLNDSGHPSLLSGFKTLLTINSKSDISSATTSVLVSDSSRSPSCASTPAKSSSIAVLSYAAPQYCRSLTSFSHFTVEFFTACQ